ncbi:hypothetical protein [Burkholderia multivorans]|uniref:hypothetical protein n=1 Tax=Burkholderia multivorans TaxID=87883 RepID=UPI00370998C2
MPIDPIPAIDAFVPIAIELAAPGTAPDVTRAFSPMATAPVMPADAPVPVLFTLTYGLSVDAALIAAFN